MTRHSSRDNLPSLFRCNLDGLNCTHADLSGGSAVSVGYPSLAIDAARGRLLVAADNRSNSQVPALFRCNIDGTSCVYSDMSAGAGGASGLGATLVINPATGELVIAAADGSNDFKSALFLLR